MAVSGLCKERSNNLYTVKQYLLVYLCYIKVFFKFCFHLICFFFGQDFLPELNKPTKHNPLNMQVSLCHPSAKSERSEACVLRGLCLKHRVVYVLYDIFDCLIDALINIKTILKNCLKSIIPLLLAYTQRS